MNLTQLVYVSRATAHADAIELVDLAHQSSARNTRDGITGALLYCDGYFLQALEGDPQAVRSLYATIQRDGRHCDCQLLSQRTIRYREFGHWGMTLLELYDHDTDRRPLELLANVVFANLHGATDAIDPEYRTLLEMVDHSLQEALMPVVTGF